MTFSRQWLPWSSRSKSYRFNEKLRLIKHIIISTFQQTKESTSNSSAKQHHHVADNNTNSCLKFLHRRYVERPMPLRRPANVQHISRLRINPVQNISIVSNLPSTIDRLCRLSKFHRLLSQLFRLVSAVAVFSILFDCHYFFPCWEPWNRVFEGVVRKSNTKRWSFVYATREVHSIW